MRAESKVEGKQEAILLIVETHFPQLVQLAQQQVLQLNKIEDLDRLIKQITKAPDENIARWAIETSVA